jgi:CBS domain containing-hemolysin-like protein
MTEWILLAVAVALIAANAVFVAAEFALVTVDRATVD